MPASLRDKLAGLIASNARVQVAVAAKRLPSGEEVLIEADRDFHPASTVKLCIMMEAFHQARQGLLALGEPIQILNSFHSLGDGESYALDPADDSEKALYDAVGLSLPLRELIERMITVSSNLATNLLLNRVGTAQTTNFMVEVGAPSLRILRGVEDKAAYRMGLNNSGTARGFMTILGKLAQRKVVSPEDSDEMLAILSRQKLNEMIPARLPAGTRVAHKTGWIADYYHDVGIIYPPEGGPIVVAILTRGYAESEFKQAQAFIAELARTVYEAWS